MGRCLKNYNVSVESEFVLLRMGTSYSSSEYANALSGSVRDEESPE
jgi:hypothetical protein